MNLALIGYGKMGRLLHQIAPESGFDVKLILDVADNPDATAITAERFTGIDVAIEFTTPETAVANLAALARAQVPAVCGTTGWLGRREEVAAAVKQNNAALVYGANFSIGVNLFARIIEEAARLFAAHQEYEAWGWEHHHSAKKDAPSGTLLMLVELMRQAGYTPRVDTSSSRAGRAPGTHEIGFDSPADTVTLRHTARSREGFARGALFAARWIIGKTGMYEFGEALFGVSRQES